MAEATGDLRVLVVATDPLARAGLGAVLAGHPCFIVVGQVGAGPDISSSLEVYLPEVIVWDLGWDPASSLEWLSDLSEAAPPVVALLPDDSYLTEVSAAGPRGILLRESAPDVLAAALSAVSQGLVVLHPEFGHPALPAPGRRPDSPPVEALTRREVEVLQLLAEGLPNKSIADRLSITEHTVKFHVNAIMGKLGAQSRTEAVTRATRLGLILL